MMKKLLVAIPMLFFLAAPHLSAADYYWVGGSGLWSDISHWATTSGGTVQHNTIPSANDRVIFDQNSFSGPNQTVTVNNQTIFFRDMVWSGATGNPRFTAPADFVMNVYGSLILIPNMVFDFKGDLVFQASSAGHTIDLNGQKLLRNAVFSGVDGGWTLATAFQVDSLLRFEDGTFNSGGQAMVCEILRVDPRTRLSIDLAESVVTITGVPFPAFPGAFLDEPVADFYLQNLTFNAAFSILDFNAPEVYVRIREFGAIQFGTMRFSSAIGNSRLELENPTNIDARFNRLEMRNDAELKGPMKFGVLLLGPGKNFILEGGRTYELNSLDAMGSCPAPIQLFSHEPGTPVTFRATSGTISGNFLSLRDIHGTGGAQFVANNSANLGNNNGWTINPKANSTLYWVGGSGMWNDPIHWALSSGGPGGACIPTADDDVFFDSNSFPTPSAVVLVNIDNAYCRSMNWTGATGNPIFMGTMEKNLRVFGSLTLIPNMQFDFEGDMFFESNRLGNTITSSGQHFLQDATFNGQGTWALNDSMTVIRDIFFRQGRLNTNSHNLNCQRFESYSTTPRSLILGNSHVKLNSPDFQYLHWRVNSQNFQFDAGSSIIEFFWYGDIDKTGRPALTYNHVIFRQYGSIYGEANTPPNIFDTLTIWGSGAFVDLNQVNVLEINRGYDYEIFQGDTLMVNKIVTPGGCSGMIEFNSNSNNATSYLHAASNQTLSRFIVKDVHSIGPGVLTAANSTDLGNTNGWVFSQDAGRDLYWVGGTGSWNDEAHWSLSSGGPGGECVPTPIDNVFFDANSFTGPDQEIYTGGWNAYCKNMLWQGVTGQPIFNANVLHLFGSITLEPNMRSNYFGTLYLRSEAAGNRIRTAGVPLITSFIPNGGGSYILEDSLRCIYFDHLHGTFNSNGKKVTTEFYGIFDANNFKKLILGGSYWRITGQDFSYRTSWAAYDTLEVQADSSLIEFTHPTARMYNQEAVHLNNVLFSAVEQTSKVETFRGTGTFNRLEFRNSGIITGQHVMDSLLFAPGKSYQLDATKPQEVKEYFQVIGNNCLSIELSSTVPGRQSTVLMNSGVVLADFVQMRDQLAQGSVEFFAGVQSTNIGNSNTGWIFDAPEDYVDDGILGVDVVLCQASSISLDARTYSPGETYRWSTGSSAPTLEVTQPGVYWVELRYTDNCVLRDSIAVLEPADFMADLPADTTLCEGDTLLLSAGIELLGMKYLWQDSSTRSEFIVRQPGKYSLRLELSGCFASDSLEVRYVAAPQVDLGPDQTLCPGQQATLDASLPVATAYRWQDGSSNPAFVVGQPGTYSVEVFSGRCPGRDTVVVAYEPALNLRLGSDTTICENATLTLTPSVTGTPATFRWLNGTTGSTLQVNSAGAYWVEATRNNCSERDTIEVSIQELPRFNLGPDTALCQGESLTLNGISLPGTSYLWSTGAMVESITVSASGLYQLQTTLNGCVFSAEKRVTFKPLPPLNLGADQTPCFGERIILNAASPGATYLWQNGSTDAQFAVDTNGLYWVQATLNGCSRRDSVRFAFKPLPEFELGGDTTLCDGEFVELAVITLPGATVSWNSGQSTAVIAVNNAGTFRATALLDGCSFSDERNIRINPRPDLELGPAQERCAGEVVVLNAAFPGATFLWQDGSSNAQLEVRTAGRYSVVSTLNGCSRRDSVDISFKPLPIFALGADTVLCAGQTLPLSVSVPGAQFQWSDGSSAATLSVAAQGLYWLEAALNGCSFRDSIQVAFVTLPLGRLGQDRVLCDGETAVLDASVSGAAYLWQDGSTGPQFTVSGPGNYSVRISAGNCAVQDTVGVVYNPLPVFELGRDTQICAPAVLALNIAAMADNYRWQDGSGNAAFTVRQTGLFRATATLDGCSWTDSIRVDVLQPAQPNLGVDTVLCEGEVLVLRANVAARAFRWQDGSTGTSFEVRSPGTYVLSALEGPCSASDSVEIGFRRCLEFKAYVPNAFSPNGDGVNDDFRPLMPESVQVLEYDFRVFDRWGTLVFQTTDASTTWDGIYRGKELPQGVYLYHVYLRYKDDKKEDSATLTGDILLTR